MTPKEGHGEMQESYAKFMRDGAIHMSDAGPALLALAKDAKMPRASVTHGKQEYLRPVKFKKSDFSAKVSQAVSKRPAANSSRYYHTIAGNNAAEGWLGNLTQLRSRLNKHGGRSTKRAMFNQLAASYLNRAPGLDRVLAAMRTYRLWAQDNRSPSEAFGKQLNVSWLPEGA